MLMTIAYMLSGWMINREYHTEYYLLVALAAAIHRLNIARSLEPVPEGAQSAPIVLPWSVPRLNFMFQPELTDEPGNSTSSPRRLWNKINWLDLTVAAAGAWAVIEIWDYILKNL